MSALPKVTITKRGVERLENGHVWIYRSDVQSMMGVKAGDAVRLIDQRGWFVGIALYSEQSQITLRLLSRDDVDPEELLKQRLALAVAMRTQLYPNESAVRLVHGEGDLLPGLIVDRYADALSIQFLTAAMDRRRDFLVDELVKLTGARIVVERSDVPARKHEGLELRKVVLRGALDGPIPYREGEIALLADLMEGQKTGAFLDQRDNHVFAGTLGRGRVLDCFSYQGGFALQLARKAETVIAVDSSEKAIADLTANAQRNGLTNVQAVGANAFDYLRAQVDAGERYDVVVLDPPAFTKSKDSIDAALRGYKEINLRALTLLRPGGLLITASCSYHVGEGLFESMLLGAAHDAGRSVQLLEKRGAGRDHPVLMGVPETQYLKCFFARAI